MPARVLSSSAVITCIHNGRVTATPSQSQVTCDGSPALVVPDLVGAPIIGCTQLSSSSTKRCTTVTATLPGSFSQTLFVGGSPVYLATLAGTTDGVPPSSLLVASPGQLTTTA